MARRLRSGDVLEVVFPTVASPAVAWPDGGYGYVTYVGKHSEDGDAIRVRPGRLFQRPTIVEELFEQSYITFYPANRAVKEGLATIVGHVLAVPMPAAFRRHGLTNGTWLIDRDHRTTVKSSLSEDECLLPIASVWNHELLLIRIAEGWSPEMDR